MTRTSHPAEETNREVFIHGWVPAIVACVVLAASAAADIVKPGMHWAQRAGALVTVLGAYVAFYRIESSPTLFGSDEERVVKASMDAIGKYFLRRLRTVFPGVANEPGVLRNSSNNPLYLLCFAVGNDRGKSIALRISEHLLRDLR
jgi:hypothetical protein